ncbi:MAG: MG2 domain-containing protein [Reichenbachiella sp.]|uniref:alpha-2-macroglobulin family protein n=1 Tax=Reichenbachiella sp. TaxID=2184521 RepID=UPI0032652464
MKTLRFFIPLIYLILISSCSSPKNEIADTVEVKYSTEVAEIISQVTAGKISPDAKVVITFVDPVVHESDLNKEIDNPFSFNPVVQGSAKWTKKNVLQFSPSKPWPVRVNYTGILDLKSVPKDFEVDDLALKFYVEGQSIDAFSAELELQNPANPQLLVYRGKVSFLQKTSLESIQKATDFSSIPVNWNQEGDRDFSFISDPIKRQADIKKHTFRMDKGELGLIESLEKIVEIVPLQKLKLSGIDLDEGGKQPKLLLKFSDQLDIQQSLDGFITINPETDFKSQQLGKHIVLDGDFKFGGEYQVTVAQGVKSKWGTKTEQAVSKTIKFSDIQPQVEFASGGIFMPTSNNKRLQFLTTNLSRVHVEVKKIFDKNVEQFFNNENIKSTKNRNSDFRKSYISTVGAIVYNQTLEIGGEKNEWLIHNLALDHVLSDFSNGLYLIRINFNPNDVLVPIDEDELTYIQKQGQIYKPITISDIGLIAKRHSKSKVDIFATDLKTGAPMAGVTVTIPNYNNGTSGVTNDQGKVTLTTRNNRLIRAEKNGQISLIKPREMQWNNSGFEVGGISSRELETQGYIYTERGVYRPGDTVNLSCIIRHNNNSAGDAPARFKLYSPEGVIIVEQKQTSAVDGFYNFKFSTDQNDPTGNWNAQVSIGNKHFYHTLKVETVVANRLKVKVTSDKKTILPQHKSMPIEVESRYLFGASADGLPYEAEVEIFDQSKAFPKYKEYSFFNQYIEFKNIKTKIKSGNLDADGKAKITWNIPNLKQAPSPLKAKITATVQEEGGRPNNAWTFVDVNPFSHYVGIKSRHRYFKINSKNDIPVVVVNHKGEAVAGRELVYRIYRNDSHWWYQYDNFKNFKLRFKSDQHSYLLEEGIVSSGKPNTTIPFQPSQRGQYLIEVQDATNQGHISSMFVSAYPYGGIPSGDLNAGTLALRTEKETYEVGDEALITFPSPKQGNILMTVERGNKILINKWITPSEQEEMRVKLKISKSMVPNAYVTITVLQEHSQTKNDRPIRMFGILPLQVINPDTKQGLHIAMVDELKPKEFFDVNISTHDGKPTQFTVAVVDEGLLDLTNFQTPNPWKTFFRKIRLEVETYDLFGHVIGANESDVFKTFSIGGDMDYRESQVDPFKKKKRFKPICMFKGPLMTDSNGKAKVNFEMPNYVGSVRVMVISANGNKYGTADKTVPVKSDLIVQPTIPRALKPGDEFEIPVNVFATKENIGNVDITMTTEGPLEVIGKKSIKHTFNTEDDQLFKFKVKVKAAVGQAKIMVSCKGATAESFFEADVPVSPSAPRIYDKSEKIVKSGESVTFDLPKMGMDGTNNARINLSLFPNMDFMHRLEYLIRYPYGCIEQTTSSVFPQLALKSLLGYDRHRAAEIDKNINAGIDRLRLFQLADGGFSYWPGGTEASAWGSNYAGQFLIEARNQGYVVSDAMYDGIIRYMERAARYPNKEKKHLMTRVNRCFVLAQANKAPLQEMNLIKQNNYQDLNNVQKWQLITSYKLAGAIDKVQNLIDSVGTNVEEYKEFSHTYGSQNRDLGLILKCLVLLERDENAALMAKYIAETLSSNHWYSTQSTGQMLLGIGSYFNYAGITAAEDLIIEGELLLPNGKKETIKSVNKYQYYINKGYGKQLTVSLDKDLTVPQLYATLSYNGVPMIDTTGYQHNNISMSVNWYNEDGENIKIGEVTQGMTFYGHYKISNESVIPRIDEVALLQLLPSGWEIENTRLSDEILPDWMRNWNTGYEDYLDIRDDRIMWFFDLSKGRPLDFVVKVNAITKGSYQLPGARCEAMYDNDYIATRPTIPVKVVEGQ